MRYLIALLLIAFPADAQLERDGWGRAPVPFIPSPQRFIPNDPVLDQPVLALPEQPIRGYQALTGATMCTLTEIRLDCDNGYSVTRRK